VIFSSSMPMNRLIDGRPGLLVSKDCNRLRKSLSGGYHFKRLAIGSGQERFRDAPSKNEHSHVGDAYGYLMLGGGEHRRLTRNPNGKPLFRQVNASMDFNVFA
jgi:hypothetical protein